MKLFINKIIAGFGNKKAAEETHVEGNIEEIINSIDEEPFAVTSQNVMYVSTKELGGFHYLITIILGAFKIKTIKGAILEIEGEDLSLELKTDTNEFESDHSAHSNCFVTRIDFQIEEEHMRIFNKESITKLILKAKKHQLEFLTT